MNLKKQTLFLFLFLLTGFFNKSHADTIPVINESKKKETKFLDDIITQYAEDSLILSLDGKIVFMHGNAKIEYKEITITASYIEINWNTKTIYASFTLDSLNKKIGKPIFTENKESFQSEEITYNFETKKCYVKEITTKEGEGYILGKTVKKLSNDIFYIQKGDYTTCDANPPHFSIRSNKIKVITGKKIITGPAYLNFFKIPTPLFFPFGYFPHNHKKSSGIILPSYGESANMGFFLKDGGYYLTLSKKMDLSLKSDIYTQGSWNIKSLLRYKNRYKYNGSFQLSYANMKNSYFGFPDYSNQKDFHIKWSHKQDPKSNPLLNFSANIEAGSSTYYRNNSYDANDYLKNSMSSNINLSKTWNNGFFKNLNISLRHNQNTANNNISLTLPDISLNSKRIYPFKLIGSSGKNDWFDKISIKYSMNSKNTISTLDSLLFTKNSISNFRNGMKHYIPISTSIRILKYFNLNSSFNLTERWYLNQINKKWENNSLKIDTINKFTRGNDYNLSTGINTKIYGQIKLKNKNIKGIRHVISPSINFIFKPDFSDEKYGYYKSIQINENGDTEKYSIMNNGIYGSPSNTKSGNINLSIDNLLEMKVKNNKDTNENIKKIKLIENIGISSYYNIFADSLKISNINLNARTRLLDIFDITFSSNYDPYITNRNNTNRVNKFELIENKRIARLKYFTTSIGFKINNNSFNKNKEDKKDDENNKIENSHFIPWNLNVDYSLTYDKGHNNAALADTIQSLNFSGNFQITKKWKIGFRSGYDFDDKKLTYSSINIYRDLHCWEATFNWIPIGYHKSYTLTIKVKAAILRDLKYEKKKDWFVPEYN